MWIYKVSFVLLMLTYSVFGSVCQAGEKEEKVLRVFNEKLNWHGALLSCSKQGMTLATVNSQQDQDMLFKAIKKTGQHSTRLWIGWSDGEGDFKLFSTNEPMKCNNFYKEQPNNIKLNVEPQNCLEVVSNGLSEYLWISSFCSTQQSYVCEYYTCCKVQ